MSRQNHTADRADVTPDHRSPAAEKILTLLEAFRPEGHVATLTELARRANLPKTTTHRLLAVLLARAVVVKTEHGYRLGPHLLELASLAHAQTTSWSMERLRPVMSRLHRRTGRTVRLAVQAGHSVVYTATLQGPPTLSAATNTAPAPLHCTASGKTFLAFGSCHDPLGASPSTLARYTPATIVSPSALHSEVERIRASRVALEREEYIPGTISLAAPVFGCGGHLEAALCIESLAPVPNMRFLMSELLQAAEHATNALACTACGPAAHH